MRRWALSSVAAFCVFAGFVLGEFVRAVRPTDYLVRPLLLAAMFALAIGLLARLLRASAIPGSVFAAAMIADPDSSISIGITLGIGVLIVYRLRMGRPPALDNPILAAAGVFFASGLFPVFSMFSWSDAPVAPTSVEGPPQYAVMLDGYPRADTLGHQGVDVSPFIDALEQYGFSVYPEATSTHQYTVRTLNEMFGQPNDEWGSVEDQRRARAQWRLPDGWVAIVAPIGQATFPNETVINPGGFSAFEAVLVTDSLLAPLAGDWVLDGYRTQLHRSLDLLSAADHEHVFAHIFAPHHPILYDAKGEPTRAASCWPVCGGSEIISGFQGIGDYVQWLNAQLVEVIDDILSRRPDAEIVLFSDHGGRFDPDDQAEWHKILFAARTPTRPGLFDESPHPGSVFELLVRHEGAEPLRAALPFAADGSPEAITRTTKAVTTGAIPRAMSK